MKTRLFYLCIAVLLCTRIIFPQEPKLLDAFDSPQSWEMRKSENVVLTPLLVAANDEGKCLKLDISALTGGYAGIEKNIVLDFPQNYSFTFLVKSDLPVFQVEFSLQDRSGNLLHTYKKNYYAAPVEWETITIRQRDLIGAFSNPAIDRPLRKPERIGIKILLQPGSLGAVYLDDLQLIEKKPATGNYNNPIAFASSSVKGNEVLRIFDKNLSSVWKSAGKQAREHIVIDFGENCEFGGLKIAWDSVLFPQEFTVSLSDNAKTWREVYAVSCGNNTISFIPIPDGEARYLKINLNKPNNKAGYIVRELGMLPAPFGSSKQVVYDEIKKMYPKGYFPVFFTNNAYHWREFTTKPLIFNSAVTDDGSVEFHTGSFVVEPFLYLDKQLLTFEQRIPGSSGFADTAGSLRVKRSYPGTELDILPFIESNTDSATMHLVYSIKNTSKKTVTGSFFLAFRPFQITSRNMPDRIIPGVGQIEQIGYDGKKVAVNNSLPVYPLGKPDAFGACEFDEGDVVLFFRNERLPLSQKIKDRNQSASGALQYKLVLKPGEVKQFYFSIPLNYSEFAQIGRAHV